MKKCFSALVSLLILALLWSLPARAQEGRESSASAALTAALVAACRHNESTFARYLTGESTEAFLALPKQQREDVMKRFILLSEPGRPLLSDDREGRTVLRCSTSGITGEMHIGRERVRENLAFVPVEVTGERSIEFGMIREGGGWRILSLGLLLVNIPELARQWAAAELSAKEAEAISLLRQLADAVRRYRDAFGRLPESLAELGPAPPEGVSPEAAQLVDAELASGEKDGYRFRYRIRPDAEGGEPGFELAATPIEYGRSGRRSFFLDSSGELRGGDKQGAVATSADPLIERPKGD